MQEREAAPTSSASASRPCVSLHYYILQPHAALALQLVALAVKDRLALPLAELPQRLDV